MLVTVNSAKPREGIDFFPLTVDYMEKIYAAGKIPGGFFKRERGMTEREVLTSRFIDRALRPLFPDGYRDETQVTAQVLSADRDYDTDVLAFVGASAAVMLSDVPFPAPIAAVRVSRVDGKYVANGTIAETEAADLNIIVAGSKDTLVMVEGGAKQVAESVVVEALRFGHQEIVKLIEAQEKLVAKAGKTKRVPPKSQRDAELERKIEALAMDRIRAASQNRVKKERYKAFDAIDAEVIATFVTPFREAKRDLEHARRGRSRTVRGPQARQRGQGHPARPARARDARGHPRRQAPHRRPLHHGHPADHVQRLGAPRSARLGAVHPRRDAGDGHGHARRQARRADDRGPEGHLLSEVLHALQLPAVLDR